MKTLLFILSLVAFASVGRAAVNVTNNGNFEDGTHYSWNLTFQTANPVSPGLGVGALHVKKGTGSGSDQNIFSQSYGYPGNTGTITAAGSFTVAPGETQTISLWFWVYNTDDGGASSPWQNSNEGSFTGTQGSGNPADTPTVTVSLRNTSGVPVKYKLMNGATQIGSTIELSPGAALIQSFPLPSGVSAGDLQVIAQINDVDFTDGQWIVQPGAVRTETVVPPGGIQTSNVHGSNTTPSSSQVVPVPMPATPSAGVSGPGSGGSVWRASTGNATTDGLTNAVFREGIDKLTQRLDGVTVEQKHFDQTAPDGYESSLVPSAVSGVLSKLPASPVVTPPTASPGVFSMTFTPPGTSAPQTLSVNLAEWETPIGVFKTLVRAALSLAFFFIVLRAIKEAFA